MFDICRFGKIQDGDDALFPEIGLYRLSLCPRALSRPQAADKTPYRKRIVKFSLFPARGGKAAGKVLLAKRR